MPVDLAAPRAEDLLPIAGLRLGVAQAGIRKADRKDLTVILLDEGAHIGAVFTQNRYCAAPVQVCRAHLAVPQPAIRALLINTGCANAGTGAQGLAAAQQSCQALAGQLGLRPEQILPFSTGVILEELPVERLVAGLPAAIAHARADHWAWASVAIMTTDTVPKACSAHATIDGVCVSVTGMAKGSGMICPNMATMLGFIATDACASPEVLAQLTREVADASFNRISVDGDTSTNDAFIIMATQRAAHAPITNVHSPAAQALKAALQDVAVRLAQSIVRDGEGATKFITVQVDGGRTPEECRLAAQAIAHSPLVKTAFFASDPNLGRILAAVGRAGIADLDPDRIELFLDNVHVVTRGGRNPAYREEQGAQVMQKNDITVRVELGRGAASATMWTCDLSHEYVRINADYRT